MEEVALLVTHYSSNLGHERDDTQQQRQRAEIETAGWIGRALRREDQNGE